ncbi:MAG: hypothetical protein K0R29_1159 [Pseudobdellovibrio sp.]|jgi:hypothetical protein|nr:hypothetical protein [Pseudobdellovibrio sp.]
MRNIKYKWLIIVVLILIVVRAALPSIALNQLNSFLGKKMENYEGHIDDLDLSLYRGAYQLQGFVIKKRNSKEEPLLSIKELDLSLAWRSLTHKHLTMDVVITEGKVRLIDSDDEKKKQFGNDESKQNWYDVFKKIIPIKIESLKMHNSEIEFNNFDLKAKVPVTLSKMELEAKDLRSRKSEELSPFHFTATLQKHAPIKASGNLDILKPFPEGDVDFEMEKFDIASINSLLRAYVPVDITKGQVSVYSEIVSEKAAIKGYLKLFLKETDVIAPKQKYKGIKHFFIEVGAAIANFFLKNPKTKDVAMKMPFEYKNGDLNASFSEAFWSAVKNSEKGEPHLKHGIDKSLTFKREK